MQRLHVLVLLAVSLLVAAVASTQARSWTQTSLRWTWGPTTRTPQHVCCNKPRRQGLTAPAQQQVLLPLQQLT
jgi:hypothetical protein